MIDSHCHLWHPGRGDYGWMPPGDETLDRPYAAAELWREAAACGVQGVVLVQAAPTVNETEYLLGIADAAPFVKGVVGWVDFERPEEAGTLRRLAGHPAFRGVRPMIQDIADPDWMLRADVQWAFEAITDLDLTFDCLGFPRHLGNFATLLGRYPRMRAVLDHCLKPRIRDPAGFDDWAGGITRIAGTTGAFCKLSGLVTEADADWSAEALWPYAEHVLAAFGAGRVMWGSDWPVSRLRGEYGQWLATARQLCARLSPAERDRVFGGTAADFYRLA
jgi:L-fuconolactonase